MSDARTVRITYGKDGKWRLVTKLAEFRNHDWEGITTDRMMEYLKSAIEEAHIK